MVGIKGTVETVNGKSTLTRVGITCALCRSTFDNPLRLALASDSTDGPIAT